MHEFFVQKDFVASVSSSLREKPLLPSRLWLRRAPIALRPRCARWRETLSRPSRRRQASPPPSPPAPGRGVTPPAAAYGERGLELTNCAGRVACAQQRLAVQLGGRFHRVRPGDRPGTLRLERRRTCERREASRFVLRRLPHQAVELVTHDLRDLLRVGIRDGGRGVAEVFERRVRASLVAEAHAGGAEREQLVDVVKDPCPFISVQSPLSTTSRAFIDASSLFRDIGLNLLPISLSTWAGWAGARQDERER